MLATGIASVTTMFAVVDKIIFEPVRAATHPNVYRIGSLQIPDFETLQSNLPEGVTAIAAYDRDWQQRLLQIPGRAERVGATRVSGGYARVMGVDAALGRWINDNDNAGGEQDPGTTADGRRIPTVRGQLGADVIVISH